MRYRAVLTILAAILAGACGSTKPSPGRGHEDRKGHNDHETNRSGFVVCVIFVICVAAAVGVAVAHGTGSAADPAVRYRSGMARSPLSSSLVGTWQLESRVDRALIWTRVG